MLPEHQSDAASKHGEIQEENTPLHCNEGCDHPDEEENNPPDKDYDPWLIREEGMVL